MKKLNRMLIVVFLSLVLAACDTPVVEMNPSEQVAEVLAPTISPSSVATSASSFITFADPVLDAMIRGSMEKKMPESAWRRRRR